MKILIATSEMTPFAKVGGLAEVSFSLAGALSKLGMDVRIILPAYGSVKEGGYQLNQVTPAFAVKMEKDEVEVTILEAENFPFKVYFVDAPFFFHRDGIYGPYPADGYVDNLERYALFCKAVILSMPLIDWIPDVVHAQDWQSALVPVYLKLLRTKASPLNRTASLLTIHNLNYQGLFPLNMMPFLEFEIVKIPWDIIEYWGQINFLKAGIVSADRVNTVSLGYRQETLKGGDTGAGLEGVLKARGEHYIGILNGIDYDAWSPNTDPYLAYPFRGDWIEFKQNNKNDLLKSCSISKSGYEIPLLGVVGRLVYQKGMDILFEVMDELNARNCALVVLGSGERVYEKQIKQFANNPKYNLFFDSSYNEKLAHQIYAGSDLFIMPSRYEPCGLAQMIAMRYGTIPIARNVGGLKDTVQDFDPRSAVGNGFKFQDFTPEALIEALDRALAVFENKLLWEQVIKNATAADFTWENSAQRYLELYREIEKEVKV